ncbi:ABC transporter permease [Pedobacter punctiformis]|uniref:ABC transporter permease n=1 Tax=Pedobacter punctiformis TaxID=3004097 RepID=A0ABT4L8X3_9SPHI|nr:ABC transporter permease [Pedobacter sp. HCMS5-2]MCZ4244355.1 ABC transporter permease [Pedobacter sp. HCMS5-2]
MFKLNLKIALRNLWRNRGITFINIGGLSIALAAFILVMIYAAYETGFDKSNPNYDRIYQVGRSMQDLKTNYTPPPLAQAIKDNFPEVEAVGKMKSGAFELPLFTNEGTVFTQNFLMADYSATQMFKIKPDYGLEKPKGESVSLFLPRAYMQTLFPHKKDNKPELVGLASKSAGQSGEVIGSVFVDPHSNISFDALYISNDLGKGEDYGFNNYQTYIQVKKGTDIYNLEQKINKLYQTELAKNSGNDDRFKSTTIFLDPLKNLHLKPKTGSDANYKVLISVSVLGFLILIIACINFTNLSIAQAAKRAKEVGVKKVMGAYRVQLAIQFLTEILIQCIAATVLSLIFAELVLPGFNSLFLVNLTIWQSNSSLIWQLPLILFFITLIAGIYPAMVLSGFKPAAVLKGNFQTSKQSYWLRNSLLVIQFSIAVIFITGLLIINSQLKYMRTQDVGFKADQVIYVKNIALFSDPAIFEPIREKIMKISGVKSVTVTNSIPDGSKLGTNTYAVDAKKELISFLDVDFDYFETLNIKLKEGRPFSKEFKTDAVNSAILNESATAKYGLTNPLGKTIRGCDMDYKIVGIIKDFKAQGFEKAVEPTIYTLKNPCGNPKTMIMIKIEESKMSETLASLKNQWLNINPKDGDNFRYQFLDQLYGKLFQKQEQLQSVFFAAAILTIFIAILGLFAFAKYITNGRIKEIAVRKILGASDLQIMKLINTSFFTMVILANLISWPVAYILTKKWLGTFAYRIEMPVLPFIISALITILLTIITVSLQATKAVKAKPVDALKYE